MISSHHFLSRHPICSEGLQAQTLGNSTITPHVHPQPAARALAEKEELEPWPHLPAGSSQILTSPARQSVNSVSC